MGFLSSIFGGTVTQPIEAIGNIFDKLFTSDDEREKARFVLEKLKQEPYLLQAEINKIEASHSSAFVAGWRPFIGWVCGISLACYFIPQALVINYVWVKDCLESGVIHEFPKLEGLIDLIFALLGLGVMRSTEKLARKR